MRRWNEIVKRMPTDRDIVGAELGVWRGKMSQGLLAALPRLTLVMIDRWAAMPNGHKYLDSGSKIATETQDNFDAAYRSALNLTTFAEGRRVVIKGDINDVVKMNTLLVGDVGSDHVENMAFDFVFIDADHTYEAVRNDLAKWFPKVKPGMLLCGHDYNHELQKGWGVKQAVDEFADDNDLEVETGDDHTWFIWKPK